MTYNQRIKRVVLKSYFNGVPVCELSKGFNVSKTTIYRWRKTYGMEILQKLLITQTEEITRLREEKKALIKVLSICMN